MEMQTFICNKNPEHQFTRPSDNASNREPCYQCDGWMKATEQNMEKQLFTQAQVDEAVSYEKGVADNCRMIANLDLPGTWINPVSNKKLYDQTAVDEAVREAKLVVLRGLPGKAPYVRPDGMMTTVDEIRTELLTTQSKSKEAEKHDATQRPNTLDT